MAGGPLGTIATALIGITLFVFGFIQLPNCSEGLSFILFGLAILMFGITVFPAGGPVIIGLSSLLCLILVIAGLVLGHGGGCGF